MKTLSVIVWTEGLNVSKYLRFQRKAGANNPEQATDPSGHAIAFSHTSLFLDQFSREFWL